MTEAEWLTSTRPMALLGYLVDERQKGRHSDRSFRLFAVAAVRLLDSLWLRRQREALEVAQRYACGLATSHELERAQRNVHMRRPVPGNSESNFAADCAVALTDANAAAAAWEVAQLFRNGEQPRLLDALPELIREVFGNPFHTPRLPDHWHVWNQGTILRLARHVREGGRSDEMPVLGDALEEAGCTDAQVLAHCRSATPHATGCWVLEMLLAEE